LTVIEIFTTSPLARWRGPLRGREIVHALEEAPGVTPHEICVMATAEG